MNIAKFKSTYFEDHPAYGCFWLDIETAFVFSFSKNVFYPNETFLCLDFSLFSVRGFDEVLNTLFRWGTHLYMSLFLSVRLSVCPSVRRISRISYLSNCTSCDHNFWETYVKWWYFQAFFFNFFLNFDFLGC